MAKPMCNHVDMDVEASVRLCPEALHWRCVLGHLTVDSY